MSDFETEALRELMKLVLNVGKQVTDDYEQKHGIWEGMSTKNKKSIDEALTALAQLHQQETLKEYKEVFKHGTVEVWNEAMYYLVETRRKTLPSSWLNKYQPDFSEPGNLNNTKGATNENR